MAKKPFIATCLVPESPVGGTTSHTMTSASPP
jgi:hypothetical protein